jgi:hypothetical protein
MLDRLKCRARTATVLGAVQGRALKRAPRAVISLDRSCAPRPSQRCRDEGRPDIFARASGGSNEGLLIKVCFHGFWVGAHDDAVRQR